MFRVIRGGFTKWVKASTIEEARKLYRESVKPKGQYDLDENIKFECEEVAEKDVPKPTPSGGRNPVYLHHIGFGKPEAWKPVEQEVQKEAVAAA